MSMFDGGSDMSDGSALLDTIDKVNAGTSGLGFSATAFAGAMTRAFAQATAGGKQFDDVLKSLALRLSNLAVTQAFKPLAKDIGGGLSDLFNGLSGGSASLTAQMGAIKPFASGGVIGAPAYFQRLPASGGGLVGGAAPEPMMPPAYGPDGGRGVAIAGAPAPNVTVQIATPDVASFRRSQAYVTGQIARAVARGQRNA